MKKRVISAVIALLISLPLVYIGGVPFYILAIIISLLAFKEMLDLITNDYWIRLVSYINFLFLAGNLLLVKISILNLMKIYKLKKLLMMQKNQTLLTIKKQLTQNLQ